MLKFQYDDLTDRWRMHRREWLFIFFPFSCTIDIYICIIRWDEKVGDKKKRKKGASRDGWNMIREWKTWGTGNVKILFFHSFQERRWRDKVVTVFSEKIHPPLPMAVDAVFFSPAFLFFSSPFSRYSEGGLVAKFRNENIDQKWNRVNFSISCFFFFFFFPSTEIESKSKGRIIQKISSNSIIPTTEEEIVGSSIDRLIKNDILQEKRKKFDCCIVSIGDRWNNLIQAKSIIDDIHSTLRFCSDFSCNEWQSGGKIKNQKLKFWKERERKGDGETRRWLVSENFIDSFIHGERKGKATVTCCTNRATRMLLLLSRKRVAFRPALHWLKAHPFRWHFPQISLRSKRDPIEMKQYRIMSLLSTRFLYNQIDCFQFNRDGYILLSFSFLFIHRIKYNLQMYIISYRFCEM